MRKIFAFAVLFCLLLTGCEQDRNMQYVTKIQVSGVYCGEPFDREYTRPDKLTKVLCFLRQTQTQERTVFVPEWLVDSRFNVTVYFIDGTVQTYIQESGFYARDGHSFRKTDPDRVEALYSIVKNMESDFS